MDFLAEFARKSGGRVLCAWRLTAVMRDASPAVQPKLMMSVTIR